MTAPDGADGSSPGRSRPWALVVVGGAVCLLVAGLLLWWGLAASITHDVSPSTAALLEPAPTTWHCGTLLDPLPSSNEWLRYDDEFHQTVGRALAHEEDGCQTARYPHYAAVVIGVLAAGVGGWLMVAVAGGLRRRRVALRASGPPGRPFDSRTDSRSALYGDDDDVLRR